MKRLRLAAAAAAVALLAFSAGYLVGRLPVAGYASISLMAAPEPLPSGRNALRGLVDVNGASAVELADIPGIGPALAARIIAYREENGPFREPGDLLSVKGIGEKTLEKISKYVAFGGADENTGG